MKGWFPPFAAEWLIALGLVLIGTLLWEIIR